MIPLVAPGRTVNFSVEGAVPMLDIYLPILVVISIAFAFAIGSVVLSRLIGVKKPSAVKLAPYECGMPLLGSAQDRFSIKFYLVAIAFVVFDVEVAFLYPWAVVFRDLGWYGFSAMGIFLFVLILGLVYDWKKGALEWE
jgi:NADH-quinone oxidoreductase subunit A